jgi:hypothetical protein
MPTTPASHPANWYFQQTLSTRYECLSNRSLYPTLNNAFLGGGVLLEGDFPTFQERIGLDEYPFRLLLCNDSLSPFKELTIDSRKFLVIGSAGGHVRGAAIHVQTKKHLAERWLAITHDSRAINMNGN